MNEKAIHDLLQVHENNLAQLIDYQKELFYKRSTYLDMDLQHEAAYLTIKIDSMDESIEYYKQIVTDLKKIIEK
jgi:tRNA splicing ligase